MKAKVAIDLNNDAFQHGQSRTELAKIFEILSKKLDYGDATLYKGIVYPLFDSNGNKVGTFEVK